MGWALTELLTDDSALQSIAKLMRSNRIALRPSLELVKVAFLAEIYKGSSERLAQMLAEYNCVITDPKLARRALQTISDSSTNFLLIRSINGLTISFHPQALQPEHWQQLLESNHLQQVVIKLIRAEINFKGRWQSILSNSSLQQAIISLESSGGNLTRDLQRLLDDSNLQKAVAVLDKIGISVKKNYRYLLASEDLQQAVILLDKQDINFKGKWQDLLEKPSLQKIISDFGNTSFRLAKNLHDLLENHSFQQAVIILDQSGIDCKRSWNGLLWSTELQQVVIALGQAQVDLKANWQQLLSDPDLRKAVMVLANAGISLGGNWQQLLENASLQKAAAVLDKVGIGLEGNAQELLANSNLQKALAAANDYLSYDFSRLGLSHGHHGKSQTKQFVRHLMAGEDKSECGVKMEMSRWVKGYGTFARSSSTQTLSRLDFACDSGLFPNSSATLFFAMSKVDREAMKQEVVSFSGK
ncbi:hypothetical protein DA717_05245 [Piscirickettsiaceae bacterium NZ-RLO2]|nr:hypothetical protein DA717_05245 [Piscirickettsiaceae bacterium NZ-RLO2]